MGQVVGDRGRRYTEVGDARGHSPGLLHCCWPRTGTERQRGEFGNFLVKAEKLEAMFLVLDTGKSQTPWPGHLS